MLTPHLKNFFLKLKPISRLDSGKRSLDIDFEKPYLRVALLSTPPPLFALPFSPTPAHVALLTRCGVFHEVLVQGPRAGFTSIENRLI
jgi:hypothetical protein